MPERLLPQRAHRSAAIAALWLFATLLHVSPATADELSIEEAIAAADKNNERARIAEQRVIQADADVDGATSDFLPTLTLGASATARPAEDSAGRYVTGSGSLTLTQPLLKPSAIPRLTSAKHSRKAAELTRDEERRELAFDTARAFLAGLAAERFLDAAKSRLSRARANLDNAQARADAELNSINDVTRAKLEVASAQREVAQRTRDSIQAKLSLEILVGEPVDRLAPPTALFTSAQSFNGENKKLTDGALTGRQDIKSLEEQTLAARDLADEPNYRLIPSLDLIGQWRVNPDPIAPQPWHEETLTLSLSWTIFDGGQRYADRRSQLASATTFELQKEQIQRTVSHEVRSSLAGLDAARASFALATEASAASRANTKETNELYQQGLARAIEVTDATAEEYAADIEAASSKIEMAASYLDVRFALGLSPIAKAGETR
ncbi:MAG: TolC family protein [Myxococcales bacterium]|nr:TolC family protein [Myxococcales bacterium]